MSRICTIDGQKHCLPTYCENNPCLPPQLNFSHVVVPTLVVAHDEHDVGSRPRGVKVRRKEPVSRSVGGRYRASKVGVSACGLQIFDFVMAFPPVETARDISFTTQSFPDNVTPSL